VGAGGLGCPIALEISALEVGSLAIFDGDKVSFSNLARQFMFKRSDVGLFKASLVKNFLEKRMSFNQQIRAYDEFLNENQAQKIATDFDLIIDGSDCQSTKNMLGKVAYDQAIPLIIASVYQQEGQVTVLIKAQDNGCLWCFMKTQVMAPSCASLGVLTHACALVAAIAVEKALAILTGSLKGGELSIIDAEKGMIKTMAIKKDPFCSHCSEYKSPSHKLVHISHDRFSRCHAIDSK
jgi:adenylyltransferase/sulfurtransferase